MVARFSSRASRYLLAFYYRPYRETHGVFDGGPFLRMPLLTMNMHEAQREREIEKQGETEKCTLYGASPAASTAVFLFFYNNSVSRELCGRWSSVLCGGRRGGGGEEARRRLNILSDHLYLMKGL